MWEGIAGAGVSGLFGIATSAINNAMAKEREKEARAENYKYNEMAADNADARTRALYADIQSPEALRRQYKEAGLSPSLMFGAGGASGATPANGAEGAGASGISPTTYGVNMLDAAQAALLVAQKKKVEAETNTINGDNERGRAEIESIITNTTNTALKNVWQEYSNTLAMLETSFEASTLDSHIERFITETNKLKEELRSAKVKAEIDEKSEQDILTYIKERNRNLVADRILKASQKALNEIHGELAKHQITLTDEQCRDLVSQIETRSEQVKINRDTLNQEIKEWAVKNGLWTNENTSYWEVLLKNLASEHTQDLIVKIFTELK